MKIENQLLNALNASKKLILANDSQIKKAILDLAFLAREKSSLIIDANKMDLAKMDLADPKFDRLKLTEERIDAIATDLENVASLPSPLGEILSETIRPNGMKISKISVPFGVIGIIYEARPNVTFDVFALCLKSGNACVLKGGSDAAFSNHTISKIIQEALADNGLDENTITLLSSGRNETFEMLNARNYIDLIIPRGSQSLIDFVRENSKIPVIETGAGICHTFLDETGDTEKAAGIVFNAKTRRPSVCNSLDCFIIHQKRLNDLPYIASKLQPKKVIIYADEKSYNVLAGKYPENLLFKATSESFGTEFLSLKMAVKTVDSFQDAILHIQKYSSKHSESIISNNTENIHQFFKIVDAAVVYSNISTAFTDGAQFGLGAEIGISTQKLHARGPMALDELTSYKWIVEGDGQVRPI